jgi:hypothetical protein
MTELFPGFEMPEMAMFSATCKTDGCENSNIAIEIQAVKAEPFIICGPCGQRIEDVILVGS